MTDDEIMDVARSYYTMGNSTSQDIIAFARAIAAAERDECAKLCEAYEMPDGTSETARILAAAIRARSEI